MPGLLSDIYDQLSCIPGFSVIFLSAAYTPSITHKAHKYLISESYILIKEWSEIVIHSQQQYNVVSLLFSKVKLNKLQIQYQKKKNPKNQQQHIAISYGNVLQVKWEV